MLRFLYNLTTDRRGQLAGYTFYPLPGWLKAYLKRLSRRDRIATIAKVLKGTDLSYIAKNDLACAESVSRIIQMVLPDFPIITGTWVLNDTLSKDARFKQVVLFDALPGDIIVSPTGYGNGTMPNGHTGVISDNNRIYSNDSATGKWLQNYTVQSWTARYKLSGGYPCNVYRISN